MKHELTVILEHRKKNRFCSVAVGEMSNCEKNCHASFPIYSCVMRRIQRPFTLSRLRPIRPLARLRSHCVLMDLKCRHVTGSLEGSLGPAVLQLNPLRLITDETLLRREKRRSHSALSSSNAEVELGSKADADLL